MDKQREVELKVGLFISLGVGLIMIAILVLGSTEGFLSRQNHYFVHFENVNGLIQGSKVVLAGIQVGTVEAIDLDEEKHDIRVTLSVAKKYAGWIRKDSGAELATQGVLGDKFLMITQGSIDQPVLADKSDLIEHPSEDFAKILGKSDALMVSLNSIAKSLDHLLKTFESNHRSENFFQGLSDSAKHISIATEKLNQELDGGHLKGAMMNLHGILEKINNGTGTLGALVNDPGLYDDTKALMGGANRNRIVRNLVRQTMKNSEETQQKQEQQEKK